MEKTVHTLILSLLTSVCVPLRAQLPDVTPPASTETPRSRCPHWPTSTRTTAGGGASGGGGVYTHDTNGNMTCDGLAGLDIEYDETNLTRCVSSGGTTLAEYEHLADGTKLSTADGIGNGYQYRGSLIYTRISDQSGAVSLALDCVLTTGGRIARVAGADGTVSYKPLVHLRDHFGSVRAVVDGARMYNQAIARWTAADPMAEEYYGVSPYAYGLGNPIKNIDVQGDSVRVYIETMGLAIHG